MSYSSVGIGREPVFDGREREFEPREDTFHRDEFAAVVGERIRRLREERGLRLGDVRQDAVRPDGGRYSVGLLSRLERGYTNSPLYAYVAIAEALGVEPGELLGPEPDPAGPSEAELTLIGALRKAQLDPEEALARLLGERG